VIKAPKLWELDDFNGEGFHNHDEPFISAGAGPSGRRCHPCVRSSCAKIATPVEIRSGVLATAGGLIFTTLTDGEFIALNDETLEGMFSFNVGTPLKAPPMTFSVNNKQYIAFQTSGLHVHPVRFTDLMHSSYLFVFGL